MIKSLHNPLSESSKYRYTSRTFKSGAVTTQQTTKTGTYNMYETASKNINVTFKSGMNFRQYMMSWYMCFFQIPYLPEWFLGRYNAMPIRQMFEKTSVNSDMFPPEVTEVYRKNAADTGALTAMLNYYRAFFRFPPRLRQLGGGVSDISVATLLIWGEQDLALSKHLAVKTLV